MALSTTEKANILKGKRYKIITESIKKRKQSGETVSFELEIDLHYAWYLTMKGIKNGS